MFMIARVRRRLLRGRTVPAITPAPSPEAIAPAEPEPPKRLTSAEYWTQHNVSGHRRFATARESLDYVAWRDGQYYGYTDFSVVRGFDGKTVVDYGCGPGNDLVGFGVFSKPARLIGADVSAPSLDQSAARLALHGIKAELVHLEQDSPHLPLADSSVDYIHSAGVLHHTPDPIAILREFRRVLKPDGTINVMVYNYDSVWVHLYVAYVRQIVQGVYADLPLRDAFRHSTDGDDCPISNVYTRDEWAAVCTEAGLKTLFLGSAFSVWERKMMDLHLSDALMSGTLPRESREFLFNITFDAHGCALHNGHRAGINGWYRMTR